MVDGDDIYPVTPNENKQIIPNTNTVDGVLPIDPVEQQRKEELEKQQKEVLQAGESVQHSLDTFTEGLNTLNKEFAVIASKRENEAISLENLIIKSFKNNPVLLPKNRTGNVCYGAQSSFVDEVDITAIGQTANEAVDAFVAYAESHQLSASFKIYPITNSLYQAILARSDEKIKKNQFPKAKLLLKDDIGYDDVTAPGMIDLINREYPYPSIQGIIELVNKLKDKITNSIQTIYIDISYGKKILGYIKIDYKDNIIDTIHYLDGEGKVSDDTIFNDTLFKTFYGECTNEISNNINNFVNTGLDSIINTWTNDGIFEMIIKLRDDTNTNKDIAIQCVYTHQDAHPKISVYFEPIKKLQTEITE